MAALRTAEECRAFFRDLCTPAELQAMADRWAVVDHVQRGLPYREIHRLTGVSVTTIGRVARFVAAGNGGYELLATRRGTRKRNGSPRRRPPPWMTAASSSPCRSPAGSPTPRSTCCCAAD